MVPTSFAGNAGRESPRKKLPIARAIWLETTNALPLNIFLSIDA